MSFKGCPTNTYLTSNGQQLFVYIDRSTKQQYFFYAATTPTSLPLIQIEAKNQEVVNRVNFVIFVTFGARYQDSMKQINKIIYNICCNQ